MEGIKDTVDKAPPWSSIVISDASLLDDSADRLADSFRGDRRVSVLKRDRTLGWRGHADLLLGEADTEFFCWMPQDDLVFPGDYFEMLVSALDRNPERALAFPVVYKRVTMGRLVRREIDPVPFLPSPGALGDGPPESEALEMLRTWNIAMAWRGVFRRDLARPTPPTEDAADLIWTFSIALSGNFIEVPDARYLKRVHRGSAHRMMRWEGAGRAAELYRIEIEARLGHDPARRDAVLAEVNRFLGRRRFQRMINPLKRARRFAANEPRIIFE